MFKIVSSLSLVSILLTGCNNHKSSSLSIDDIRVQSTPMFNTKNTFSPLFLEGGTVSISTGVFIREKVDIVLDGSKTSTYTIVTAPNHGKISGDGKNITYIPDSNYFDTDSFTYKVSDGNKSSNIATVDIGVRAFSISMEGNGTLLNLNAIYDKDVKLIKTTLSSDKDSENDTKVTITPVKYDDKNHVLETKWNYNKPHDKKESLPFKELFTYDNFGHMLTYNTTFSDDNQSHQFKYTNTYDENHRLIKKLYDNEADGIDEEEYTYMYDENGLLTTKHKVDINQESTHEITYQYTYKYDDKGNIVSVTQTEGDDSILTIFSDNIIHQNTDLNSDGSTDSSVKFTLKISK